jgi:sugar phosphate isomerase/epimerase
MHYICFSKLFKELSINRLVESMHDIGAQGIDLCVRDGYPVNPSNVRNELTKAAERIRKAGLEIPLVSASTNLTNPNDRTAEPLFAACHDAHVPNIKLGYWKFSGRGYWKDVDAARKELEGFEKLGSRFGVRACLHTHSGTYLGLNAASLMDLARGFNPSHVGAYLDPGHLALCGEPPAMAVDITGDYLCMVAIKDCLWILGKDGAPRKSHFLPLGQGMVEWADVLRALKARNYPGPLSFHSEYEDLSTAQILDQTRKDLRFMRKLETEVNG